MRLLPMLGYVLVAVCASVVGGITETELKRVMEPTVVIASHVYRGYVVDDAFEAAVQSHLIPASLAMLGLDCPATPNPSKLCQLLTADNAVILNLDHTPRAIPLPQTTSPAVFAASLIQSAYPQLVREFPSVGKLRAGLAGGASLILAYMPRPHAASKVVFLNVAKQFDLLKLKFALITDLDVVRGVAPGSAVPAPGGGVLVWYTALVGGTRGWKLMSYPTGLNEDFTVFVRRCTFPAHVHYRGKESHNVFKGSGLPQAFVLVDNAHQHLEESLIKRLAAELLGDYSIMTINIDTHPEMLEFFQGPNLDSLPDFFVRPTPGEIVTLSPDIPRTPHALASTLRHIISDRRAQPPANPEDEAGGVGVQTLTIEEFGSFVDGLQQAAIALLCIEDHIHCSQLRETIHDLAESVPEETEDVKLVLVQVQGGMAGLTPLSKRGVVLTGLPMLLVYNEQEWHQFESDLSFNGIVEFVQKTLKWSVATANTVLNNHARILDSLRSDVSEESLYPAQLQEDDEIGVFVNEHKITAKLFKHFDRDPLQLQDTIAAYPQTVVAFYQPWSVLSRAFLPHLPEIQALAEAHGVHVGVCSVNCQGYPDLCEQYEVTVYPTVLVLKGEGQRDVHRGVLGAQQIIESLVDSKANGVEEATPYSLPGLLLVGKPLAILLLPPDGLALLASLAPPPPHLTLVWLNQTRYQHILGSLRHVYGNRPPSLVAIDTNESQNHVRRCKPKGAGPLDVAAIDGCLREVGGKWLSWEQPVRLAPAKWPPKMDPLPFPSGNGKESQEPLPAADVYEEQLPVPSHVEHTEL